MDVVSECALAEQSKLYFYILSQYEPVRAKTRFFFNGIGQQVAKTKATRWDHIKTPTDTGATLLRWERKNCVIVPPSVPLYILREKLF